MIHLPLAQKAGNLCGVLVPRGDQQLRIEKGGADRRDRPPGGGVKTGVNVVA